VCAECGHYKGREVVVIDEEIFEDELEEAAE
jgi:hypothetical protein